MVIGATMTIKREMKLKYGVNIGNNPRIEAGTIIYIEKWDFEHQEGTATIHGFTHVYVNETDLKEI